MRVEINQLVNYQGFADQITARSSTKKFSGSTGGSREFN